MRTGRPAGAGSRTTCRPGSRHDAAGGMTGKSCPYCAVWPGPRWLSSAGLGTPAGMTSQPGGMLPFPDRRGAGRLLAERLAAVVDFSQWAERAVIIALPRGGVAVGRAVAEFM